ncbi:MAG TPA: ABC transporter permease, partial [Planctomycetota bacterium]|nr:ABC transporter permease [Planctomycetota bacterium]
IPLVAHSSGYIRLNNSQCVNGNRNWNTQIQGVEESYLDVRSWPVADGKMFTDQDVMQASRVCVLGERVADELFAIGSLVDDGPAARASAPRARENPLGVTIKIRGMPFRVIGVLTAKGQSAMGQDQDDVILVPVTTALRRLGAMMSSAAPSAVDRVQVSAIDAASVEPAMDAVRDLLARRHRSGSPDEFTVRNFGDMARVAADQQRIIALLLATVAAISLVVGGIGIMNIMLVSVTERTREIGLRLAVGAKREHILGQFLLEALAISGLGGLAGIGIAYICSSLIQSNLEWAAPISPAAVAVAVGVSVAIGVFFGFYPARMASRLDPIEALRYE